MALAHLDADILEIKPTAEDDQGAVYEQEVILRLSNGVKISAYDWHFIFTKNLKDGSTRVSSAKEFEGTKRRLRLYIAAFEIKKTKEIVKRVIQINSELGELKPSCFDFYGKVIDLISKYDYYTEHSKSVKVTEEDKKKIRLLILDIGVGTIEVGLDVTDKIYDDFNIGDYVEVSKGWIEIKQLLN